MKSHLQSYPCPLIINYFWNLGFLLGITILLQIISGIFLGLHYNQILIQHILVFSLLLEKYIMDGVYVIFILINLSFFLYFYILEELYLMVHIFIIQILGFLELLYFLLDGNSIYGLCVTFRTNEFMGG